MKSVRKEAVGLKKLIGIIQNIPNDVCLVVTYYQMPHVGCMLQDRAHKPI